jgi:hypothetical protein
MQCRYNTQARSSLCYSAIDQLLLWVFVLSFLLVGIVRLLLNY